MYIECTINGLHLQANVASAVLTQIELDCATGLILVHCVRKLRG